MRGVQQFAVLIFAVFLMACHRQDMADLDSGKQLQIDCVHLMGKVSIGEIPATLWPRSIKDLKPIRVTRQENSIRILTAQERGKFTVGYDVFADGQMSPSTQGVWVQKTKTKGVYIFKMAY